MLETLPGLERQCPSQSPHQARTRHLNPPTAADDNVRDGKGEDAAKERGSNKKEAPKLTLFALEVDDGRGGLVKDFRSPGLLDCPAVLMVAATTISIIRGG